MTSTTYTVTFKEPVTLRMLEAACVHLGLGMDDVLDSPTEALDGYHVPLAKAQGFCEIVCEGEIPDVYDMPVEEAEAFAAWVAADFFSHVFLQRVRKRLADSDPSLKEQVFQMALEDQLAYSE